MKSLRIKTELASVITDEDGRILQRRPWTRCHSLTVGFLRLLLAQFSQSNQTITDTSGTARTGSATAYNLAMNAGTATNLNIVIGTGTDAHKTTDYKLASQVTANIAHGTPTQLVENPDENNARLIIIRQFINNTGSILGIREVGLYAYFAGTTYVVCIERTLYSADVPIGKTITLTYRFTIST